RFLGECGAQVLALEGSARRAEITRLRTRDLSNVRVLAENLIDLDIDQQFDVVTLIGVLEYSPLFFEDEQGCELALQHLKRFVKPGGLFVVAIENQLGLKYFAGHPEDHIDVAMYGLENRYKPHQPRTFGKVELTSLLSDVGFNAVDYLYPFPDYKMPQCVITERGFNQPGFDVAPLIRKAGELSMDRTLPTAFFSGLVWPQLARNGIASDLSNSFLVLARREQAAESDHSVLAAHYSVSRQACYRKETVFRSDTDGAPITVQSRKLCPNAAAERAHDALYRHRVEDHSAYLAGTLLSEHIYTYLTSHAWGVDGLAALFAHYLGCLDQIVTRDGSDHAADSLDGQYFDLLPQNIIVDAGGEAHAFDLEWALQEPLPRRFLLTRALFASFDSLDHCAPPEEGTPLLWSALTLEVSSRCGLMISIDDYERYLEREREFRKVANGRVAATLSDMMAYEVPVAHNVQTLYQMEVQKLHDTLNDSHRAEAMYLEAIKARDDELARIRASVFWRVTRPLRWMARMLRRSQQSA
ncbi:MAG: class I SAM-dependent methyltransferase, partial [Pseudomonadota bacterium]